MLNCERRALRIRADEQENGVRLRRIREFEQVGSVGEDAVLLVRPDSSLFARRRAERLSRRAVREPLGAGGYDVPQFWAESEHQIVPQLHSHALLLAQACRAVGMIVVERRALAGRLEWSIEQKKYGAIIDDATSARSWTIVHVWLLERLRGKQIAERMLDLVFDGFGTSATEVGWLPPFSAGGKRMLERRALSTLRIAATLAPTDAGTFTRPFSDGREVGPAEQWVAV